MSYESKDIQIFVNNVHESGTGVYYNNKFWYFVRVDDEIVQITCDMSGDPDIHQGDLESSKRWDHQTIHKADFSFSDYSGNKIGVDPVQAVVLGDELLVIWLEWDKSNRKALVKTKRLNEITEKPRSSDSHGEKPSSEKPSGGEQPNWTKPINLVSGYLTDISDDLKNASYFDGEVDSRVIATSNIAATAWGKYLLLCVSNDQWVSLKLYDPATRKGHTWHPYKNYARPIATWTGMPKTLGSYVSLAIYTQPGEKENSISNHFVASFYDRKSKKVSVFQWINVPLAKDWPSDQNEGAFGDHWNQTEFSGCDLGWNMTRDPAGRILANYAHGTRSHQRVMNTYTDIWGGPWDEIHDFSEKISKFAPNSTFVFGPNKETTVKVNDEDKPATEKMVYEFFVVRNEHKFYCKIKEYGKVREIPHYAAVDLPPTSKDGHALYMVQGIIDGPVPVPRSNIVHGGEDYYAAAGSNIGKVIHGATEGKKKSHNWSISGGFGFKSSESSSKGVGPAWDIAVSTTAGGSFGGSKTTALSQIIESDTRYSFDSKNLIPVGTIIGSGARFISTLYQFLEPAKHGEYKLVKNAPKLTAITVMPSGEVPIPFEPYSVCPGDLESYTEHGWNSRMEELGLGQNYFEKVIRENAYEFPNGNKFLSFSWGRSGLIKESFQSMSSSFKAWSWSFDSSLYAGVSGGEGLNFFGLGENFSFSATGGITFSASAGGETAKDDQWSIDASIALPGPTQKGDVIDYAFRLYFLPADKRWAKELKNHLDDKALSAQIDPNSEPWRIVFEVLPEYQVQPE